MAFSKVQFGKGMKGVKDMTTEKKPTKPRKV